MKVKLCLDRKEYHMKPKDKKEICAISKRIAEQPIVEETAKIAELVGDRGHTMTPATFTGGIRKREYFSEMQIFVLDFDGGISYESVKSICKEYGLPIHFSYYTFSSTEVIPKFRVVFCHVVPIQNIWMTELILSMLKTIFPQADKNCFEAARMFFGGRRIIELNQEAVFRVDELIKSYQFFLYKMDKVNYRRNIQNFGNKYGIDVLDGGILNVHTYRFGEIEEKKGNPIKYMIELPLISSKIVFYGSQVDRSVVHHNYMCGDLSILEKIGNNRLCERCRLCKDFLEGRYLTHDQRFLLATNFLWIKGKKKLFLQTIKDYYRDSYDKWEFDWKYMKGKNYKPKACDGLCPYADKCNHAINICLTLKGRKGIVKLDPDEKYKSIDDCCSFMEEALINIVSYPRKGIHLIKGQTGLGKSTAYKKLMSRVDTPMIIAVPTVKLKNEIAKNVGDIAIEALSLEDLCMPQCLSEEVKALYSRGLYKEARQEIVNYEKKLENDMERIRYQEYLQLHEIMKNKNKHIIVTHAQLFQMSNLQLEGYQIIVDEDILLTMLRNTKSVEKQDVQACINSGLVTGKAASELQRLLEMNNDSYMQVRSSDHNVYIEKEKLDKAGIYGNINELLNAGSYHCVDEKIEYYVPHKLNGKSLIIMSATLDEEIYKLYFKSTDIFVYDTPKAKYTGKVVQYTYHSMSREKMKELGRQLGGEDKLIELIRATAPGAEYEISFKAYDGLLKGGLHFGNASGIDRYKGKNGIIIGTPHLNESSYKLIACYLGVVTSGEGATISRQKICYKGYEFYMMTYKDEDLRKIQLYMISSELEQCIGRSRLLREDATVYVFSNFPCEQAELIQEDYLVEKKVTDVSIPDTSVMIKECA